MLRKAETMVSWVHKNRQRKVEPQNYMFFLKFQIFVMKWLCRQRIVFKIIFWYFGNYLLKITTFLSYKIKQKLKRIGLLILGS